MTSVLKYFLSAFLFLCTGAGAQGVQWKTTDAALHQSLDGKPILVDIYTDWCHNCKIMDLTTYRNDSVKTYLEQNFHAIKINGESRDSLSWFGEKYGYVKVYKTNALTPLLTNGQVAYPATIIIPAKGEKQIVLGGRNVREMELLLKYYGSRANETMDFETFMKQFSSNW